MQPRSSPTVAALVAKVAAAKEEGGVAAVVSRAIDHLLAPVSVRVAARRLRPRLQQASTLAEQMEVVTSFSYRQFSLRPSQIDAELEGFLRLIQEARPRAVLEIGTALGGTAALLACAAADDAVVVSVDLPLGPVRAPLVAAASRASQRIECLRADSHDPRTRTAVAELLGGRQVDVLFIDGDHTSDGVRKDLELYGALAGPGAWIAFHDIVPGPYEFVGGVPELWAELRSRHETHEFVADWGQGGLGIGAYRKS